MPISQMFTAESPQVDEEGDTTREPTAKTLSITHQYINGEVCENMNNT